MKIILNKTILLLYAITIGLSACKKDNKENACDDDIALVSHSANGSDTRTSCFKFISVKHSYKNNIEEEHRYGSVSITAKSVDGRQDGFILTVRAKGVTDFFSVSPSSGNFDARYQITLPNGAINYDYGYFSVSNLKVTKIDKTSRTISFSFDKISTTTSNGGTLEIEGQTFTDIKVE